MVHSLSMCGGGNERASASQPSPNQAEVEIGIDMSIQ